LIAMSCGALALFAAGTATAADLPPRTPEPPRAPVYVPPTYNWTGFYVGGHFGAASGPETMTDVNGVFVAPGTGIRSRPNEFLGGGQLGFNYQMGGIVLGAEVDESWTNWKGSTTTAIGALAVPPATAAATSIQTVDKASAFATVTGRLGFAVDNWLFYGKGGGALMNTDVSINALLGTPLAVAGGATISDTRTGWTAGGGLEVGFWNNWSAKVEYDYMDFGTNHYNFSLVGVTAPIDVSTKVHVVKGAINYRFGWGSPPVIARY